MAENQPTDEEKSNGADADANASKSKKPRRTAATDNAPGITLQTKRLLQTTLFSLLAIEILLVCLDLYFRGLGSDAPRQIRQLVNLTREDSVGTWFATTQTFFVSVILWIHLARCSFERRSPRTIIIFGLLAGFFSYTSMDDGSKFHERIGSVWKSAAERRAKESKQNKTGESEDDESEAKKKSQSEEDDSGAGAGGTSLVEKRGSLMQKLFDLFPSYPWQVVFMPVFGVMGLLLLYVIFIEIRVTSARVAVFAALTLLVLAVGIDFIEGISKYSDFKFGDFISKANPDARHNAKVVEEFMEMFAMTLMFVGFTRHLLDEFPQWQVRFY